MQSDKKITIIGGGHGSSVVLSGLADSGYGLSAVLSMADDGGSTGRLRDQYGVSPPGDIRQCLVALSTNPQLADLYAFRFQGGELDGHSLGNLVLAAGELSTGSMSRSIAMARKALGVEADIIPVTEENCNLVLENGDRQVRGVYKIANTVLEDREPQLSLEPPVRLSSAAKEALTGSDMTVIAPGNFYCSIIPALLVKGVTEAVNSSKSKVVLVCNLVNRDNHTSGFSVDDYVSEIERLSGGLKIDEVIYNTARLGADHMRPGEEAVEAGEEDLGRLGYKLVGRQIADSEKAVENKSDKIAALRSLARHDSRKLGAVLSEIVENI